MTLTELAAPTEDELKELAETTIREEIWLLCVIGLNIKRIRKSRGDRQCDLLLASPNVSSVDSARTNGNRIESGRLTMTTARVAELAALLSVPVRELLKVPRTDEGVAELRDLEEKRLADRGLSPKLVDV